MALVGAWKKITSYLNDVPARLAREKNDVLKEAGEFAKITVQSKIANQAIGGPPLKDETIKQKIREGYSRLTLIRTGEYKQSFTVTFLSGNELIVGPADERNQKIMIFMEFGTKDIPARPHVGPALRKMNDKIPRMLKDRGFIYTGRSSR